MRSIKELLELLLIQHSKMVYYEHGLCFAIYHLLVQDIINLQEESLLYRYIQEKAEPRWWQLRYYCVGGIGRGYNRPYYWNPKDHKGRTRWLNKHIKLNS